jgi:hypothetical protein
MVAKFATHTHRGSPPRVQSADLRVLTASNTTIIMHTLPHIYGHETSRGNCRLIHVALAIIIIIIIILVRFAAARRDASSSNPVGETRF